MYSLKDICKIIEELKNCSSTNGKKFILEKNKDNELLKKVLLYTYDKNKKYGLSKTFFKSYQFDENNCDSIFNNLFTMLDILASSNINDDLRKNVTRYLNYYSDEEVRKLLIMILSKDLKCGINTKLINKAIPGLIFDFQVMKASSYNEKTKDNFEKKAKKDGYMISIKENGERGIVIKENGKITIKSRQNKIFEQLVEIEEAFKNMADNYVYEGELLAFNPNGGDWNTSEEEFKLTNKILHTKGVKRGVYIKLFDMIPLKDFEVGVSNVKAIDRKRVLKEEVEKNNNKFIQFATIIYEGKDTSLIEKYLKKYSENSFKEGLMILLNDSIYESKRVNYHLKVKLWQTADLRVIGLNESLEKPNTLGSLTVDFKGEPQGVSGIKDDLKELWWNNPDKIIGKIIEVKYKSATKDKEGKESLQFCSFVRVRDDKDEVNFD